MKQLNLTNEDKDNIKKVALDLSARIGLVGGITRAEEVREVITVLMECIHTINQNGLVASSTSLTK